MNANNNDVFFGNLSRIRTNQGNLNPNSQVNNNNSQSLDANQNHIDNQVLSFNEGMNNINTF
jgi:hypothetical protein